MRHLVYSVRYSMITINSSLLSKALNSSVIKTPVYNDTEYLNDVITEPVFLGLTGYYDNDNEFLYILRGFKMSDDAFRLSYSIAFYCSIRPFLDLFHSCLYILHLSTFSGDGLVFSFPLGFQ